MAISSEAHLWELVQRTQYNTGSSGVDCLSTCKALARRSHIRIVIGLLATIFVANVVDCLSFFGPLRAEDEVITTVLGNGLYGNNEIFAPNKITTSNTGSVYMVDYFGYRLQKLDTTSGAISVIIPLPKEGRKGGFSGDGGAANTAMYNGISGIAVDGSGNIFLMDCFNNRIRRIDVLTENVGTVVGNGQQGFSGDGGLATSAMINTANTYAAHYGSLALDGNGNIYFSDSGNERIRRVDGETGIITTVAGNGLKGVILEGAPAATQPIGITTGVAVDAADNVYFTARSQLWLANAGTGNLTRIAGNENESYGFSGDGGPSRLAALDTPTDICLDQSLHIYILDTGNARIRDVDLASQTISTVAGGGTLGDDGCSPISAVLFYPISLCIDSSDRIYYADSYSAKIRLIEPGSIADTNDADFDGFSNAIEIAAGTNPLDPNSTPFNGNPALAGYMPTFSTRTAISNNLASNATVLLKGTLALASSASIDPSFLNKKVIIALGGGVNRLFTLDSNGHGHQGFDSLKIKFNKRSGTVTFSATLKGCDLSGLLNSAIHLTSTPPNSKDVEATELLLFENTIFSSDVDIQFFISKSGGAIGGNGTSNGSGFGIVTGRH